MNTPRNADNFPGVRIAVVIPSYRVIAHIADVIAKIPGMVWRIYVVDDACPDGSGAFVAANINDQRVRIIYHTQNLGVGGAVMTGYHAAIADAADVIVKVDGDGQMDPSLIPDFVEPILSGDADYTKGNRFYDLEEIRLMPLARVFGNAVLSLMTKLSSGYWNLFDPTNGYTAIHANTAKRLPFDKISRRYFFETDMLFRLNTLHAVVTDIPMDAKYGAEISNLKISRIAGDFLFKHVRNFLKRIFYNYYLRDLSLASIELPVGLIMLFFGISFGGYHWLKSAQLGIPTAAGTVMLAAMPMLMGLQLVLAFIGYDIASVPRRPLNRRRSYALSNSGPEQR
jgi:glycosyltransferase involved in cell wall biosynthesis